MPTKTILAVDDNPINLFLYKSLLKEHDCNVVAAQDALSALDFLKKHKPDLILLDLIMPEMDGVEFLEEIREVSLNKDLPVVVVTADADEKHIEKVWQLGISDCVSKPIRKEDFLERIEKAFD